MNASLTRSLPTTLALLATLLFTAACASGGLPPKASEKELEQGWKYGGAPSVGGIQASASSFKSRINIYLFKEMDEFFCQPLTPDGQKIMGDKGYLKDGKRGVGWHTVPLRVRIISKHTSERRITWKFYCRGKIARTP